MGNGDDVRYRSLGGVHARRNSGGRLLSSVSRHASFPDVRARRARRRGLEKVGSKRSREVLSLAREDGFSSPKKVCSGISVGVAREQPRRSR